MDVTECSASGLWRAVCGGEQQGKTIANASTGCHSGRLTFLFGKVEATLCLQMKKV